MFFMIFGRDLQDVTFQLWSQRKSDKLLVEFTVNAASIMSMDDHGDCVVNKFRKGCNGKYILTVKIEQVNQNTSIENQNTITDSVSRQDDQGIVSNSILTSSELLMSLYWVSTKSRDQIDLDLETTDISIDPIVLERLYKRDLLFGSTLVGISNGNSEDLDFEIESNTEIELLDFSSLFELENQLLENNGNGLVDQLYSASILPLNSRTKMVLDLAQNLIYKYL